MASEDNSENTIEANFHRIEGVFAKIAQENGFQEYTMKLKNDEFTGTNYSSNIIHVQIASRHDTDKAINLLAKLTECTDKEKRKKYFDLYDLIYSTELLAYTTILPEFMKFQETQEIPTSNQFICPKFYKGSCEYLKEYMVLEDLSFRGFTMFPKRDTIDFQHGKVIMENMARYHAISYAMKEKYPDKLRQLRKLLESKNYPRLKIYGDVIQDLVIVLVDKIAAQISCQKTRKVIQELIADSSNTIQKCLDPKYSEPHSVMCHGDVHINNMMFSFKNAEPQVYFIDWQWMRYGSPASEIVHTMYSCTDKAFRDTNLSKLCHLYYETLKENLLLYGCEVERLYPKEIFTKQLHHVTPFGVIYGVLNSIMITCKDGEEKKFDEIMSGKTTLTLTEDMLERLQGFADDIVSLKSCQ